METPPVPARVLIATLALNWRIDLETAAVAEAAAAVVAVEERVLKEVLEKDERTADVNLRLNMLGNFFLLFFKPHHHFDSHPHT